MNELATALALVLVVEGMIYALFPETMKRLMAQMMGQPASAMRIAGLIVAAVGIGLVWVFKTWL